MGPVGVQEMVVIFLVALLLFGPKKLPELGKSIGKAITEFRRAQSELKATFESHMRELEKESESIKEVTRSYTNEIYNHYNDVRLPSYTDSITHQLRIATIHYSKSIHCKRIRTSGRRIQLSLLRHQPNGTVPRGRLRSASEPTPSQTAQSQPVAPESIRSTASTETK